MAFFQPGDESKSGQQTSTTNRNETQTNMPSRALAGAAQTRLALLAHLLNYAGQAGPTQSLPGGLGGDLAPLIALMGQPGAFNSATNLTGTDTTTSQGNLRTTPASPSMLSDLASLATVGALLNQSGALGSVASGANSIWNSIMNNQTPTSAYTDPSALDPSTVYGDVISTDTGASSPITLEDGSIFYP